MGVMEGFVSCHGLLGVVGGRGPWRFFGPRAASRSWGHRTVFEIAVTCLHFVVSLSLREGWWWSEVGGRVRTCPLDHGMG